MTGLKKWCRTEIWLFSQAQSMLILKSPYLQQDASKIFAGSGVKIELDGRTHLGAVIGSEKYRKEYVSSKVDNWVRDID